MPATLYFGKNSGAQCLSAHRAGLLGTKLNAYKIDNESKIILTGPLAGQDFRTVNPKGNLPTLVLESGLVLNEFSPILQWIVDNAINPVGPKHGSELRYVLQTKLSFAASELLAVAVDIRSKDLSDGVRSYFKNKFKSKLEYLNDHELKGKKKYWIGNDFTVVDAYLYFILSFAEDMDISFGANLSFYYKNLKNSSFVKDAIHFMENNLEISVQDVKNSADLSDAPSPQKKLFRTSFLGHKHSLSETNSKASNSDNSLRKSEPQNPADSLFTRSKKPLGTLYYAKMSSGVANFIAAYRAGILGTKLVAHEVSLATKKILTGPNAGEDYLAINPRGNVPAILLSDGSILHENAATLQWILENAVTPVGPPNGTDERYFLQSKLSFVSSEIHLYLSDLLATSTNAEARSFFIQKLKSKLQYTNDQELSDRKKFWVGDEYTIVDAYASFIFGAIGFVGLSLAAYPNVQFYTDGINNLDFVRTAQTLLQEEETIQT
ncbi:hypothetical protein HDU83_008697 [Entophlyctis luteolus]|nr:hypothetical protein HDU82_003381 [Entophlyctis luteolus]KAJ3351795.1 hypothetical protein HDU83_008697 [Entophlyctis luteolus]KAJ3383844.1 hypothetical protein HDU84_003366 [Entophlyctis sp. JEL0112]